MSVQFTWQATPISIWAISPNSGTPAGGTAVTLQGFGFLTGATVTFGGLAATSVVVVSAQKITCVTPAHAAAGVVCVVTNTDTTTASIGFSYINTPFGFSVDYITTGGSVGKIRLTNGPISISQSLGQPASCTFSTDVEPSGDGAVSIVTLGVNLFAGTTSRKKRREEEGKFITWDNTAIDLTWQLRRSYPGGLAWVSQTGVTAITALLNAFAPAFTLHIDATLTTLLSYTTNGTKSLDSVLTDLCNLCGGTWFIEGGDLYVFNTTSGITVSTVVTESNVLLGSPSVEWDYSQIRNNVTVYYAAPSGSTSQPKVNAQDASSIALYSQRDYGISRTDLPDQASAIAYARMLLLQYAKPIPTVSYQTRDLTTRIGRTVTIALAMIAGSFIVRTVGISQIDEGFDGTTAVAPIFTVTATPPNIPMSYISPSSGVSTVVAALQQSLASVQQQNAPPALTGDVVTQGGAATIPQSSVTNCQLAGCIDGSSKLNDGSVPSAKLTSTGIVAGTYGG